MKRILFAMVLMSACAGNSPTRADLCAEAITAACVRFADCYGNGSAPFQACDDVMRPILCPAGTEDEPAPDIGTCVAAIEAESCSGAWLISFDALAVCR